MQPPSAQPPDDRLFLGGFYEDVLQRLREAALRILAFHGNTLAAERIGPHHHPAVRRAHKDGFKITYYRSTPGAIFRAPGTWSTDQGSYRDPCQHVLDVELDGLVLGIGWRGDGYIEHDRFERGPWEYDLLKAAAIPLEYPFTVDHLVAFPNKKRRWRAPHDVYKLSSRDTLKAPITFSVVGYAKSVINFVEEGSSGEDVSAAVRTAYGALREVEGDLYLQDGQTTSFGLRAWSDRRAIRGGKQTGAPGLRYRIGFDSLELCGRLLLAFDCELAFERRHPSAPEVLSWRKDMVRRPGAYSRWDLPPRASNTEANSIAA